MPAFNGIHFRTRYPLAALLVLIASTSGLAQEGRVPASTLSELVPEASPGRRVEVTTTSGVEERGEVEFVNETTLRLRTDSGPRDFPESDLREVRTQGDRLWNGMAIGAVVGAGIGAASCAGDNIETEYCLSVMVGAVGVPVGLLVGLLVDRAFPHREILYSGSPGVGRWEIDPVIGRERYGARLALRF